MERLTSRRKDRFRCRHVKMPLRDRQTGRRMYSDRDKQIKRGRQVKLQTNKRLCQLRRMDSNKQIKRES